MRFRRPAGLKIREEDRDDGGLLPGPAAQPGPERWSTTFLMVGSALLGATALALWNRRTIASLRAEIQSRAEKQPPRDAAFRQDIY